MNPDNKHLAFIEGGRFESPEFGDDRKTVIAEMKMSGGFKLSARSMIVLEVEEYDTLRNLMDRTMALLNDLGGNKCPHCKASVHIWNDHKRGCPVRRVGTEYAELKGEVG